MNSTWLMIVGAAALAVYVYCIWREETAQRNMVREARSALEKARRGTPREMPVWEEDWPAEALFSALKALAREEDSGETVYIFMDRDKKACRWSKNAYRLPGETELCTVAPGGIEKIAGRFRRGEGRGLAEDILRAHAKKHGY